MEVTTEKNSSTRRVARRKVVEGPQAVVLDERPVAKKAGRKLSRWLFPLAVIAILAGAAYYFKSFFVAAMVNNKPISHISLVRELESQGGKTVLDNMVDKELIAQAAKKNNVVVSQADIDAQVKKIDDQLKAQGSTIDAALASRGQTLQSFKDSIRLQKTVEAILASKVAVSDDEAKAYFDSNKATFGKDAKYDDVKTNILQQLSQDKLNTEYQTWITDLRAKAKINYFVKF